MGKSSEEETKSLPKLIQQSLTALSEMGALKSPQPQSFQPPFATSLSEKGLEDFWQKAEASLAKPSQAFAAWGCFFYLHYAEAESFKGVENRRNFFSEHFLAKGEAWQVDADFRFFSLHTENFEAFGELGLDQIGWVVVGSHGKGLENRALSAFKAWQLPVLPFWAEIWAELAQGFQKKPWRLWSWQKNLGFSKSGKNVSRSQGLWINASQPFAEELYGWFQNQFPETLGLDRAEWVKGAVTVALDRTGFFGVNDLAGLLQMWQSAHKMLGQGLAKLSEQLSYWEQEKSRLKLIGTPLILHLLDSHAAKDLDLWLAHLAHVAPLLWKKDYGFSSLVFSEPITGVTLLAEVLEDTLSVHFHSAAQIYALARFLHWVEPYFRME